MTDVRKKHALTLMYNRPPDSPPKDVPEWAMALFGISPAAIKAEIDRAIIAEMYRQAGITPPVAGT